MKRLFTLVSLLILSLSSYADIILSAGESFTFSFATNDFVYQYDLPPSSNAIEFSFNMQGPFHSETIFTVSLYDDSLSDIPFYIRSTTNGPTSFSYNLMMPFTFSFIDNETVPHWTDAQGIARFEIQQGDVQITDITAGTVIDGKYLTASIPEPSSVVLLIVGGGAIYLRKKRFPTRTWSRHGTTPGF